MCVITSRRVISLLLRLIRSQAIVKLMEMQRGGKNIAAVLFSRTLEIWVSSSVGRAAPQHISVCGVGRGFESLYYVAMGR